MSTKLWNISRRQAALFLCAVFVLIFIPEPPVWGAQTSVVPFPKIKPSLISAKAHTRIQYSLFDLRKAQNGAVSATTSRATPTRKPSQDVTKLQRANLNKAPIKPKRYRTARKRTSSEQQRVAHLQKRITQLLKQDYISLAERTLEQANKTHDLDSVEYDLMRGQIAAAALYHGDYKRAQVLAEQSADRSALHAPKAAWIAGLSHWIAEDYDKAAQYFEISARSPYVSQWQKSAASYWAARAHREIGNTREAKGWLEHAGGAQNTFYGLLALRTLDQSFKLTPDLQKKYPRPRWATRTQYGINPDLVHAIALQESRFNPNARSRSGAKGLMQIMPGTARHVAQRINVDLGDNQQNLYMPETNLKIGQAYLAELLKFKNINGDITSLLIAYNAGPGNLAKWKKKWPDVDDPLLFIELIPLSETRAYVEKVLTSYWIYRIRDRKPTPTLDSFAFANKTQYANHSAHILIRVADRR